MSIQLTSEGPLTSKVSFPSSQSFWDRRRFLPPQLKTGKKGLMARNILFQSYNASIGQEKLRYVQVDRARDRKDRKEGQQRGRLQGEV